MRSDGPYDGGDGSGSRRWSQEYSSSPRRRLLVDQTHIENLLPLSLFPEERGVPGQLKTRDPLLVVLPDVLQTGFK